MVGRVAQWRDGCMRMRMRDHLCMRAQAVQWWDGFMGLGGMVQWWDGCIRVVQWWDGFLRLGGVVQWWDRCMRAVQ